MSQTGTAVPHVLCKKPVTKFRSIYSEMQRKTG